MSDTEFQTDDLAFSALIYMVFGPEALTGIEIVSSRERRFTFEDVPRFDCEAYKTDWDSAEGLAISNVRAYMSCYFALTSKLRDMNVKNQTSWTAERGERWWVRAREQGNAIVALREAYEKRKSR